ncbi:hypothetical protein [Bartonella phoceensis]|uniref:hypothetical protein n=1 Tax=Bartonella phoceensis TaxID=270249 RepID=UPI001ABAD607|nr:hypothetical protein [Bartonella phoceensis]
MGCRGRGVEGKESSVEEEGVRVEQNAANEKSKGGKCGVSNTGEDLGMELGECLVEER